MHGLSIAVLQGIEKSAFLWLLMSPNPNPHSALLLRGSRRVLTIYMYRSDDNALGRRCACNPGPRMTQIAILLNLDDELYHFASEKA
jgi:hypothetical protein